MLIHLILLFFLHSSSSSSSSLPRGAGHDALGVIVEDARVHAFQCQVSLGLQEGGKEGGKTRGREGLKGRGRVEGGRKG